MPENFLADPAAVLVRQEKMMALARPIDASIPSSFINHPRSPLKRTSRRNLRRSLYWRSESGLRVRRGLPTGHRSRPIRRGTRPPQVIGSQGAIGCSRRIGSVSEEYAALDRRPRVTLRSATLHFARPAACIPKPHEKGTGGRFFCRPPATHGTRASFGIRRLEDRSREPQRSVRDPPKIRQASLLRDGPFLPWPRTLCPAEERNSNRPHPPRC